MESTFQWMGNAFSKASEGYCLFPSFRSGTLDEKKETIFKCTVAYIFDPSETHVNKEKQN